MAATTRTAECGTAYFSRLAAERLDIAPCRASAAVARASDERGRPSAILAELLRPVPAVAEA
ncbi:hypothetical protein [Nonomuraea sp. NPDC003709]|uniref:hypothetical protein n=1 Tax=Nonomuraea sp. NPDC003709 TaxID=3154450 RepID=UPI0033BD788B